MASQQQSNLFKVLSDRLKERLADGDLQQAKKIAQSAVESARRSVDGHDEGLPVLLEALRELASLHLSAEDMPSAELVYQEAFGLARGSRYVSAREIAMLKSELAGALDVQGKGNEAIPLYQDAVEIFESASVDEPLLAAKLRNNLAMIFKERGSLEMAEEHYLVSLDAFEAAYGAESLQVATVYNNIGGLYQAAGHLDRALEIHQRALECRNRVGGSNSLESGQSLSNIAAAYHAMGKYPEADRYYRSAIGVLAQHGQAAREIAEITEENHQLLLNDAGNAVNANESSTPPATEFLGLSSSPIRLARRVALG